MNERSHCPYLGLRQNRAIRFASPTAEHRCYVSGEAQEIPVEQRSFCLSVNHLSCPLYTGEWSATTPAAVTGAGALALPQRGVRGRLAGRDNLFYLAVVGMILTITLVWVGIYVLYSMSSTAGPGVALGATATTTAQPTATTMPSPTPEPTPTNTPISRPPRPSGLTALISERGVQLSWERSRDARVTGYNVYRRSAAGAFELLNDKLLPRTTLVYIDRAPLAGARSAYGVTTVDSTGTESEHATINVPVPSEKPSATPSASPVPPTDTAAPTAVPPTPTERVIFVPGPTVIVPGPTVVVPVPVTPVPTREPSPTPEPTATDVPTETPIPPTAAPTPIPAATETPTSPPPPSEPPAASDPPTQSSSPAPSVVASDPPPAPTPEPSSPPPDASPAP